LFYMILFRNTPKLQQALAGDDTQSAKKSVSGLKNNLAQINMELLKGKAHKAWMEQIKKLNGSIDKISAAKLIKEQRTHFAVLSNQLIITIRKFPPLHKTIYKASCPMAFNNQGASWLQQSDEIFNPYFGQMMLHCGSIDEEINLPRVLEGVGNEQ
ncbi:DUF3347 domain-containing protein, partial [bacterium]|nr:DUF3347 domain-containing protein [bacterium]